jgi:predicted phage terminase large subunit-like protein
MGATEIRPQPGKQEAFLATAADIAIYGGAAGGGKSHALLMEPLRHIVNPKFGAVIFRRQMTDVLKEGGLWDTSGDLYGSLSAKANQQLHNYTFLSGARVSFGQGAQIALLEFDELSHFTRSQFFYMLSRNRSLCGVKPYVRATTNPDADSWVAGFIGWWINPDTGLPIPQRSGVLRYFVRRGDDIIWGDSAKELAGAHPDVKESEVKSVTFIGSNIYDNKILLEKDLGYLGNLKALNLVDRERLLGGNWKIRPSAGLYFKRSYFEVIDAAPAGLKAVRRWDLAGTDAKEGTDPDWTVGLKLSRDAKGIFYVEHVERFHGSPKKVEAAISNIAASDGKDVTISIPQDPGQAGKAQSSYLVGQLAGYQVMSERETGDKVTRAGPASSQAEVGNIKVVRGAWNEAFFGELENFPSERGHDDQVDALAGAVNDILQPTPGAGWLNYAESQAAQAEKPESAEKTTAVATVRMKAPKPYDCVQAKSGTNYTSDAEGFADIAEDDVASLTVARWKKL